MSADQTVTEVLDVHRWLSMGVSSVQCECGEILTGDESLTQFPADEAFRGHVARAVLAAVDAQVRADERRRCVEAIEALTLAGDLSGEPWDRGYKVAVRDAARVISGLGGEETP